MSTKTLLSTPATPSVPATDFPPLSFPFDSSAVSTGANFILRSSDGIDFYVHKHMLTLQNPDSYFINLFSDSSPGKTDLHDSLPLVRLDEDSHVLGELLRTCMEDISYYSAEQVVEVASVARKYVMDGTLRNISRRVLKSGLIAQDPFRFYCISVAYQWREVCRKAARLCLSLSFDTLAFARCDEDRLISGRDFRCLLDYYVACRDKVKSRIEVPQNGRLKIYVGSGHEYRASTCGCHLSIDALFVGTPGSEPSVEGRVQTWVPSLLKEMSDLLWTAPEPSFLLRFDKFESLPRVIRTASVCNCEDRDIQLKRFTSMVLRYEAYLQDLINRVAVELSF